MLPATEQLKLLKKGIIDLVSEQELLKKLERSVQTGNPLRVKAGFDLSQKLEVNVTARDVNIKVPKAKILTIEPLSIIVEELRDGLWNKIQPQDVDRELQRMQDLARTKASSLPDDAELTLKRLLSQKLGDLNIHLETQSDAGLPN